MTWQPWQDRGMCKALEEKAYIPEAYRLMKELYSNGIIRWDAFYFPCHDAQHVRLIAFYLLKEYILSEGLYKEWS